MSLIDLLRRARAELREHASEYHHQTAPGLLAEIDAALSEAPEPAHEYIRIDSIPSPKTRTLPAVSLTPREAFGDAWPVVSDSPDVFTRGSGVSMSGVESRGLTYEWQEGQERDPLAEIRPDSPEVPARVGGDVLALGLDPDRDPRGNGEG